MYSQIESNKRKTAFLIAVFLILIISIGWLIGEATGYGYSGLVLALVISLVMTLVSYYKGDKIALSMSGAKEIKKEDNPYVFRLVENLCITAGVPMPKVYLINDEAMNAFATGRNPEHSSIALTTGIVNRLENEELEGVIAHELSHIKNYDIRLMTIVIVLVGAVVFFADFTFRAGLGGGRKSGHSNPVFYIIGIALLILSPLLAKIIQLAISRKREFLADASGALLTRYPDGLANALEKISASNLPVKKANNATAHLYIANPFSGTKNFISKLFSTHPPINERINSLREMTRKP